MVAIPSGSISEDKLLLAKRAGVDTDETTIAGFIEHARDQFLQHFESLAFSRALEVAWSVVARVDKMITDAKPWDLAKDENQRQTLDAFCIERRKRCAGCRVLLYPVMPEASRAIGSQLGLADSPAQNRSGDLKWGELTEGAAIGEVQPVFPRIDKAKMMAEINGASPEGVYATEADAAPKLLRIRKPAAAADDARN